VRRPPLKIIEFAAASAGAALLLVAAAAVADAYFMSRAALSEFAATSVADVPPSTSPDGALGVLRITRVGIEVPVFPDTSRVALRHGVGVIEGTAPPGSVGNIGIAGHRDGFFRPLKDIAVGDAIELVTRGAVQTFRVATIRIVDPLDTSVLDPTEATQLTLVTCYPFYYVGYAPDRYIVHAALESQRDTGDPVGTTPRVVPADQPTPSRETRSIRT
jgi:LPXTG-site transpeptidase (sortase) family protein